MPGEDFYLRQNSRKDFGGLFFGWDGPKLFPLREKTGGLSNF
jgi:hypothetical protein